MNANPGRSDCVCQAQGMVSVQAHCTVEEALAKMNEQAKASAVSLDAIALAVVERRVRFDVHGLHTGSLD